MIIVIVNNHSQVNNIFFRSTLPLFLLPLLLLLVLLLLLLLFLSPPPFPPSSPHVLDVKRNAPLEVSQEVFEGPCPLLVVGGVADSEASDGHRVVLVDGDGEGQLHRAVLSEQERLRKED